MTLNNVFTSNRAKESERERKTANERVKDIRHYFCGAVEIKIMKKKKEKIPLASNIYVEFVNQVE